MKKAIIAVAALCTVAIVSCKKPGAKRCFTCTITSFDTTTHVKQAQFCETTQEQMDEEAAYQKRINHITYLCN